MRSARLLGIAPAVALVALFSACDKVGLGEGGTATVETNWGHRASHGLPPADRRHAQAADQIFLTMLTPTAAFRGNQSAFVGNALGTSSSLVTAVLVREARLQPHTSSVEFHDDRRGRGSAARDAAECGRLPSHAGGADDDGRRVR